MFTSSWDGKAKAWTINSKHVGPVNQVSFSPDGTRLATAGRDGTVKLWDPVSGEVLQNLFPDIATSAWRLHLRQMAMRLATASVDQSVKIWDTVTGEEIATLQGHERYESHDVVCHPQG